MSVGAPPLGLSFPRAFGGNPVTLPSARHSSASWNPALASGCLGARASTRPLGEQVTFFACTKKVTKEMHPGCRALRATRSGYARSCRGSLNAHPCAYNELARILRATLTGLFVMPSPRQTGPENQEQRRVRLLLLIFGSPLHCGDSGRKGPQGRRDGSRRFRYCTGGAISGTRPLTRTLRAKPEGRNALGRVSLPTFSARAEKVGRSPEGRVEACALGPITKSKSKVAGFPLRARGNDEQESRQELDSRLRGNDERRKALARVSV
jgi:hypothetical protein